VKLAKKETKAAAPKKAETKTEKKTVAKKPAAKKATTTVSISILFHHAHLVAPRRSLLVEVQRSRSTFLPPRILRRVFHITYF
jgi:hypothetical protein